MIAWWTETSPVLFTMATFVVGCLCGITLTLIVLVTA